MKLYTARMRSAMVSRLAPAARKISWTQGSSCKHSVDLPQGPFFDRHVVRDTSPSTGTCRSVRGC